MTDALIEGRHFQNAPTRPPAIFANSHFCAFALYPRDVRLSGEVEISGESCEGQISLRVPLPSHCARREQSILHPMAARTLIKDIEQGDALDTSSSVSNATKLSLGFSILCRGTAFVAVDQQDGFERPVS